MKNVTTEEWYAIREVLGHLRTMELAKLEKKVIQLENQLATALKRADTLEAHYLEVWEKLVRLRTTNVSLETRLAKAREENAQLCGYDSYAEQEKTLAGQGGE